MEPSIVLVTAAMYSLVRFHYALSSCTLTAVAVYVWDKGVTGIFKSAALLILQIHLGSPQRTQLCAEKYMRDHLKNYIHK